MSILLIPSLSCGERKQTWTFDLSLVFFILMAQAQPYWAEPSASIELVKATCGRVRFCSGFHLVKLIIPRPTHAEPSGDGPRRVAQLTLYMPKQPTSSPSLIAPLPLFAFSASATYTPLCPPGGWWIARDREAEEPEMLQLLLAVALSAVPLTLYLPPIRSLNLFVETVESLLAEVAVYSMRAYPRIRLGVRRIVAYAARAHH